MTDFIAVYDNALDADVCQQIIERCASSGARYPGVTGSGVDPRMKDSLDVNLSMSPDWLDLYKPVLDATRRHLLKYVLKFPYLLLGAMAAKRLDSTTGEQHVLTPNDLTPSMAEQLLQKIYRPGEVTAQQYRRNQGGYHHWHSEIFPAAPDCESLHRVLLFMFYLNTVEQGGETEFYFQQRKVSPVRGRMVIAPAGFTHTHKGHVPESDDKWILTSWVLFHRAEVIQGSRK